MSLLFYAEDLGNRYGYEDIDLFIESCKDGESPDNHYLHMRLTKCEDKCWMTLIPKVEPDGEALAASQDINIPPELFDAFRKALEKDT